VGAQIDGRRGREMATRGEMIVEEQARADHPHRAQVRGMRHHEAQRPRDVRRRCEQHFALEQRLAHQREMKLLEIA